jgi:glycosyltransferase involved in cell wall biosynthesis
LQHTQKPKVLVLLPNVPFPPNDGGRICSYSFIENLRDAYNFTVLMPVVDEMQSQLIDKQSEAWNNVELIGVAVSSAKTSNPKLIKRLFKPYLDFIRKFINAIEGKTAKEALRRRSYSESNIGNLLRITAYPEYIEKLNLILQVDKFDIIQTEYFPNLALVNILPSQSKKLYVEIESRYSILQDEASIDKSHSDFYKKFVIEQVKSFESSLMKKYDGIIALSENDKTRLQNLLPGYKIHYSPYGLIGENKNELNRDRFCVNKLIFVGPEGHYPNRDAVEWFVNTVHSDLLALNIEFHIIGNWSKEFRQRYKKFAMVRFTGFVQDLSVYSLNSIHVVPIRIGGGGLRAKNLVCLAEGIPIVGTKLGCDGVRLTDGLDVLFAETPNDIITGVKLLLNNQDAAFQLAERGREYYVRHHSAHVVTKIRDNIYKEVLQ